MTVKKIVLDEEEIPNQWYNILPDLPRPICARALLTILYSYSWYRY